MEFRNRHVVHVYPIDAGRNHDPDTGSCQERWNRKQQPGGGAGESFQDREAETDAFRHDWQRVGLQ